MELGSGQTWIDFTKNLAGNLLFYRWQRRLTHFYKLVNSHTPHYLVQYVLEQKHSPCNLRRCNNYPKMSAGTERFSHAYFPYCVREWNQLDSHIRTQLTVTSFKRKLIEIRRPEKRSIFKDSDLKGFKTVNPLAC